MARGPRVVPIRQPPQGVGDWWQRLARDDRGRIIADLAGHDRFARIVPVGMDSEAT